MVLLFEMLLLMLAYILGANDAIDRNSCSLNSAPDGIKNDTDVCSDDGDVICYHIIADMICSCSRCSI